MRTQLKGSVVVVTGASSGIGRATALEMARRGAHVALLARRRGPLEELGRECERLTPGVRALVLPTDTTDETAVKAAAHAAVNELGRLDVWVNAAAVLAASRFVDTPPRVFRRVVDVNLMGYVHGALAALTHFVQRGRGVIINVASVESVLPFPYFSAYGASKHAVRGFTRSLRQELEHLGHTGIRVREVLPATIDTPLFEHAANYTGRALRAMPPIYPPERVARAIVELAEDPSARDRVVGQAGRV
ncbi:MAG TPA: SDR family oxidoreductase, partial [Polyangiaceae bacterium]|nr:SDR family oxidoreductase [Polyangiaceae bacterium]